MATPQKGQNWRVYVDDSQTALEFDDTGSISNSGSISYVKVGETREKELSRTAETISKASDNAPKHGTYVKGLREAEFTLSALYVPSDTGGQELEKNIDADGPVAIKFAGKDSGDEKKEFNGHVTEITEVANLNELAQLEVTIQVDGQIVDGTVA